MTSNSIPQSPSRSLWTSRYRDGVPKLFSAYRILATIVGVLLTVLVFVAVPLKYLPADHTTAQNFGSNLTSVVGVAHGWCYIVYLIIAFMISRRARWESGFTLLVLAAGLIPILIFWVEARVVRRLRGEFPELAATT